jgi:hypothetical protein
MNSSGLVTWLGLGLGWGCGVRVVRVGLGLGWLGLGLGLGLGLVLTLGASRPSRCRGSCGSGGCLISIDWLTGS